MKQIKMAVVACLIALTLVANATATIDSVSRDTKIFYVLKNSGIVTEVNGKVTDMREHAKLHVGEKLYLNFPDGFDTIYTATMGDNPWIVAGKLIDYLEPLHGSVNSGGIPTSHAGGVPSGYSNEAAATNFSLDDIPAFLAGIPSWLWMVLALIAAGVIAMAVNRYQKRRAKEAADAETKRLEKVESDRIANDPVLAGPPVIPGGITDNNVHEVMQHAAQTSFSKPLVPVVVHSMERGTINAQSALVFFNGERSKDNMQVVDRRGVRAVVTIGDETQTRTVYALQECGNPLRVGNWIQGPGIEFTPDSVGANIPVNTLLNPINGNEVIALNPATSAMLQNAINTVKAVGAGGEVSLKVNNAGGEVVNFNLKVNPKELALQTADKN